MRVLPLVAAALLVAGCAAPGEDKKQQDPLFGLCPQWVQAPGGVTGVIELGQNGSLARELGPANATYLARPLDMFRIVVTKVEVDGTLELRATAANGDRLSLRDYRLGKSQIVPVATIDPSAAGQEFDVFLSSVLEDGPTAPTPASLQWQLDGTHASVDYNVTYHYKVCGL